MYEPSIERNPPSLSGRDHAGHHEESESVMRPDRHRAPAERRKTPDLPVKVEDPEQPKGNNSK
jgi:hypothetical protein